MTPGTRPCARCQDRALEEVRAMAAEEVGERMGVDECVQAVLALSSDDIASVQNKLWAALLGNK